MRKYFVIMIFVGISIDCSLNVANAGNPRWWGGGPPPTDNKSGDSGKSADFSNDMAKLRAAGKFRDTTRAGDRITQQPSSINDSFNQPMQPSTGGFKGPFRKNSPSYRPPDNLHHLQRSNFDCNEVSKICSTAKSNCQELQKKKELNGEALDYTLQYLANNFQGLQDSSCAKKSEQYASNAGKPSGAPISKGLQTGRFVLNDFDSTLQNGRAQAYYVDLCGGEFRTYSVKRGSGAGYGDDNGANTTLIGAFMTSNKTRDFGPQSPSRYAAAGLKNPRAINIVGLNSSNDKTAHRKPFHESPTNWNTSLGCPSIDKENGDIIEKIAGGSLVMNYKQGFMQSGKSCQNGDGHRAMSPGSSGSKGNQ